jgi:hypothetical protein
MNMGWNYSSFLATYLNIEIPQKDGFMGQIQFHLLGLYDNVYAKACTN